MTGERATPGHVSPTKESGKLRAKADAIRAAALSMSHPSPSYFQEALRLEKRANLLERR